MILYFTGTGNSGAVAQRIAAGTQEECICINDWIKDNRRERIASKKPLVFVCPIYAWRIPRVVEQFIRERTFEGNRNAYFVTTCGSGAGNAAKYAGQLCQKKGLVFYGLAQIVMPENYIAMFSVPQEAEAKRILAEAQPRIEQILSDIREESPLPEERNSMLGRFLSGPVNPLFYATCVKAKGFYAKDCCTGCGRCEKRCPLNNIRMEEGRPLWGENCTHCMACICSCPAEAIEYKNKSRGKPRYQNPDYQK